MEKILFTPNPFVALADFMTSAILQAYVVPGVLAIVIVTVIDSHHRNKIRFFLQARRPCFLPWSLPWRSSAFRFVPTRVG
ncbi:MAG: hypothetical protein Q7J36_01135 [Thiobacillus sp.]|nr:hypothetical protein [Thiobacillus sp.]